MKVSVLVSALAALTLLFQSGIGRAGEGPGDPTAATSDDGKYFTKDGDPTFRVKDDGTVDWYTYSGFRRYNSECIVCHGPNGDGSSFAPVLKESVQRLSYADFLGTVASGRKNVTTANQNVMPTFGDNRNVMCYIDDIYIYLRARGAGKVGEGRPEKHDDRPDTFARNEAACMGGT
ncbi:MAG: c-type cytochrome, methanol metabolism-related [Bradyrhizobiaceae bacterium]|nr:c-type cytochrome, methanol metabolism-related [Bradyrhizobiaceae bacterium]